MAQLRQDYAEFSRQNTEVIAVGPDSPEAFRTFWEVQEIPFVGLADPKHSVADLYGQEVNLLKMGRMPALLVIDQQGIIRYRHNGSSMKDIPENREVLAIIDELEK